ncbi:MAG: glycoside hydrolase family 73 protein [Patescibacteria group bacterium]
MSEKNTHDIVSNSHEIASGNKEAHPVFAEKPQTREQINMETANDRIRLLQSEEKKTKDLERKGEIRTQINAIRRENNRNAQKDAYINPTLTQDASFAKQAKELLGDGSVDSISAKNLLKLERTKRGSLSKFFAFKKTTDEKGNDLEEPLDVSKIKEGDNIIIDFGRNSSADIKIGAGDLIPINIQAVSITDTKGRVRVGIRSVVNGKVGYYDESGYMEIHNGYTLHILTAKEVKSALTALEGKVTLSTDEKKENDAMDSFIEQADRFPSLAQRLTSSNIEQYKSYQEKATVLAKQIESETGIPWQVTYGQATLETGYGQHAPGNNYFGMKGSGQSQKTKEVINGVEVTVQAGFKTYASMEESFADYARLISTSARYKKAFEFKNDPEAFLTEIIRGGYATDLAYVGKVKSIW